MPPFPRQRVRRLFLRRAFSFAVMLMACCAYSHSIYAAHMTANIEKIDGDSMIQTMVFDQDIRRLKRGDTVTVATELPMTFTLSANTQMADGSHSIIGQSAADERLLISVDDKASYGSISGEELNYTISTDAVRGVILVDQSHQEFPEIDMSNDGLVPPNKRSDLPGILQMSPSQKAQLEQFTQPDLSINNNTNGVSDITMLIIYSSEFGQGFASPTARINDLLNFTNQSLGDSDIKIEFTLARAQQINFDNNLSTNAVLTQVTNGTGAFSGVAALRDQVGADMVAVLSFSEGFSANGVAWINGDNPNFAFSSTRLSPGCCNSVFAHELGHNLGSGHERASVNSAANPCSDFNFTGFSCGHGNASRNWGTIMSRLNSRNAGNVFSNPLSTSCLGEPCGIPENQANSADNTRSFNMSRLLVENFRDDPFGLPDGPSGPRNNDAFGLPAIINILLDDD